MDSEPVLGDDALRMRIEIRIPGKDEAKMFTFPQVYTVDKVKTEIFRNMPSLDESMKFDYYLGLDEQNLLKVEFTKLVKCHPTIAAKAAADEVIQLYLISRSATTASPDLSKIKTLRGKFPFGGRTEELPAVPGSPTHRKMSAADVNTSLVAKRASVFSVPNEEPKLPRPKAMTSGLAGRPIFTSPRVPPSSAASEEDPNSKGDSRMRRTNSFGERADRAKTLKQGSGSTSAKSSSGPVSIDRTSTQQPRASVSQPSTPNESRRGGGDTPATPEGSGKRGHRRTRSTGFIASEIIKKSVGISDSSPDKSDEEPAEESSLFGLRLGRRATTMSGSQGAGPRVRAAHQIFRSSSLNISVKENLEPFPPKRMPLAEEEEQIGNSLVNVVEGYLVEVGRRTLTPELAENTLYNPELNYTWYVDYFKGKEHENYIASDPEFGTVVVSTISETDDKGKAYYRVIIRTKYCDVVSLIPKSDFITNTFKKTSVRDIVRAASSALADRLPKANYKLIKNPALHAELEDFETKQLVKKYKIGVLYCKEGQTQEDEMFCNETGSEAFESFLNFLGDRIELQGWKQYRAGLDVNGGSTGTHSVYTMWNGTEIMFHVSTLLPFTPGDRQQIERKRHLGNDILMIVFKEGNGPAFSPNTITSEFNHVFAVISPDDGSYGETLRSSGGITPRRLDDSEEDRSNRFSKAKTVSNSSSAGSEKSKARASRSPPRRRVQEISISRDGRSSPRGVPGSGTPTPPTSARGESKSLTRSPTKKDASYYRLALTRKDGVPSFGPYFEGDIFPKNQQFRDFLFYKLINGERAAYDAPVFNKKMVRVRGELLKHLEKTYA